MEIPATPTSVFFFLHSSDGDFARRAFIKMKRSQKFSQFIKRLTKYFSLKKIIFYCRLRRMKLAHAQINRMCSFMNAQWRRIQIRFTHPSITSWMNAVHINSRRIRHVNFRFRKWSAHSLGIMVKFRRIHNRRVGLSSCVISLICTSRGSLNDAPTLRPQRLYDQKKTSAEFTHNQNMQLYQK